MFWRRPWCGLHTGPSHSKSQSIVGEACALNFHPGPGERPLVDQAIRRYLLTSVQESRSTPLEA
jgi:hypothetical protein